MTVKPPTQIIAEHAAASKAKALLAICRHEAFKTAQDLERELAEIAEKRATGIYTITDPIDRKKFDLIYAYNQCGLTEGLKAIQTRPELRTRILVQEYYLDCIEAGGGITERSAREGRRA